MRGWVQMPSSAPSRGRRAACPTIPVGKTGLHSGAGTINLLSVKESVYAMARLRHGQLRRFAAVTGFLADTPEPGVSLSNFLLGAVAQLIPLDRVSYNEVDRHEGRLITAHSFNEAADPALIGGLNRFIHQHPGFARANPADPWPAPTLLSDHLSQRQFRQLGLYQEHFRLYGIHYQLGASFVVSAARRVSFGLNRATRNFTEEDRLMIGLLRQHLAAAWRRGRTEEEIAAAVSMRDAALTGIGAAVVVLDRNGETVYRNDDAERLMTRYGISARLMAWARRQLEAGGSAARIAVERADGHLLAVFTRAPRADGWHLLRLTERPAAASARPLEALGLARREAETLFWLARGKRNAEIAVICGMHATTVSTHLRSVFAKLGVETRTAAAALAWETLSEAAAAVKAAELPG